MLKDTKTEVVFHHTFLACSLVPLHEDASHKRLTTSVALHPIINRSQQTSTRPSPSRVPKTRATSRHDCRSLLSYFELSCVAIAPRCPRTDVHSHPANHWKYFKKAGSNMAAWISLLPALARRISSILSSASVHSYSVAGPINRHHDGNTGVPL